MSQPPPPSLGLPRPQSARAEHWPFPGGASCNSPLGEVVPESRRLPAGRLTFCVPGPGRLLQVLSHPHICDVQTQDQPHLLFTWPSLEPLCRVALGLATLASPLPIQETGVAFPLGLWNLHTIMELSYLTLLCVPFPTALSLGWRSGFIGPHGPLNPEPALNFHPGCPAWFMGLLPMLSGRVMGHNPSFRVLAL